MQYLPLFKEDKPHFHTSGGQLAVGFRIYTYLSGTDTPVSMYTDPSGSKVYENPIVLDGRGEPSGQGIYATPEAKYKIVLKTPDESVVWSMDDVNCAGSSEGGGGDDSAMFLAVHGETEYNDINNAIAKRQVVFCLYRNDEQIGDALLLPLVNDDNSGRDRVFTFSGICKENVIYSTKFSLSSGWSSVETHKIPSVGVVKL